MSRTTCNILIFLFGATAGAIATRYLLREEYTRRVDEEVRELKELYEQKAWCEDKIAKNDQKKTETHYEKLVQKEGYVTAFNQHADAVDRPYVITPDEFGELDDYNTVTLFWYANDILADEDDEVVDDIPEIVGDALAHFDSEDSVYVRNDTKRCDYEVLRSLKDYTDIS